MGKVMIIKNADFSSVSIGNVDIPTFDTSVIYFNTNYEGGEIKSQRVINGDTILPYNATRANYKLGGWYLDEDFVNQFNFSDAINESLTLYAKWIENSDEPLEPSVYTEENANYQDGKHYRSNFSVGAIVPSTRYDTPDTLAGVSCAKFDIPTGASFMLKNCGTSQYATTAMVVKKSNHEVVLNLGTANFFTYGYDSTIGNTTYPAIEITEDCYLFINTNTSSKSKFYLVVNPQM